MPSINETAYPRLSYNVTKKNLHKIYTPTSDEHLWLNKQRLSESSVLVGMIYLKCIQRLGYFPKSSEIPSSIRTHIANILNIEYNDENIQDLVSISTHSYLKNRIRDYCNLTKYTSALNGHWLNTFALTMARTKENIIDIINAMLEMLVKEQYELPAFSTLERIAYSAREEFNANYFKTIAKSLSEQTKIALLNLLSETISDGTTLWNKLKYEPAKPSVRNLQYFIAHFSWLKEIQINASELPSIPEEKRFQFIFEAKAYSSDKMKSIQYNKRIALIALFVREQMLRSMDNLVDLFIKEMRKLHNKSQIDLKAFQENSVSESEQLILILRDVSITLTGDKKINEQHEKILSTMENNPEKIAHRCDRLVTYGLKNPLQFLSKRFTNPLRKALLDCLSLLNIDHTTQGSHLLACVKTILHYRSETLFSLAVSAISDFTEDDEMPLDWLKTSWHSVLFEDNNRHIKNRMMVYKYFEISVLSEVARRFQSGDLYISDSIKYDDYRNHLVSWEEHHQLVGKFCETTGIPLEAKQFTTQLKETFTDVAKRTDNKIPKDSYVEICNGDLFLKKRESSSDSTLQKRLDQALKDQLPEVNIIDLLVDTTQWLKLNKKFGPLSGHQRKIHDYHKRLVATLFCYGCNLGPTQTARSIKEVSRKQVAYLNLSHTREKDLVDATGEVINAYNQFELPGYWGSGKTGSVDGTRFDMYEQNLMSEYHLRYASYGGIGYYLVSDKYIALFSRFIPCGVREALHLIDGIMENTSDIQPDTIHGDTHAQSTVVFGLAHLLGIKLMPRIKDIKSMIFFNPDQRINFKHIDSLFSEGINYNVIRKYYKDMLRIAVSISEGRVSASTIIRRLGSKGIRNSLYYAFRELGRVVRTQFLLQYIGDIDLREMINAATCKSEEFNNFIQWVFFYNNGVIQENFRYEQDKIIRYNHLVSNLIILHNVNAMTRALNTIKKEGFPLTPELLRGLSPYRTEHINLLGDYSINITKRVGCCHFELD